MPLGLCHFFVLEKLGVQNEPFFGKFDQKCMKFGTFYNFQLWEFALSQIKKLSCSNLFSKWGYIVLKVTHSKITCREQYFVQKKRAKSKSKNTLEQLFQTSQPSNIVFLVINTKATISAKWDLTQLAPERRKPFVTHYTLQLAAAFFGSFPKGDFLHLREMFFKCVCLPWKFNFAPLRR
jgi:hypothetical protein